MRGRARGRVLAVSLLAASLSLAAAVRAEEATPEEAADARSRGARGEEANRTERKPAPPGAPSAPGDEPWRLDEAVGVPGWLRIGLSHRARVEILRRDFRASGSGRGTGLFLRTLLPVELRFAPLTVGAELQDARAYASGGTALDTTSVNPVELLQAYGALRHDGLFLPGDAASAKVGRLTMDVGSRRLVARNDFRNTINNFTGYDVSWRAPDQHTLRTFAVMPVRRLPSEPAALGENEIVFDREDTDAVLLGTHFTSGPLGWGVKLEIYTLGLHERDGDEVPSRNRQLVTPGARAFRVSTPGDLDFEVEAIAQLGTSRATPSPDDKVDLAHRAFATHAVVGYRFAVPSTPRIGLGYDYVSGDADPADDQNGRFDTLFGARRFEYGPTGLYGAIARSNFHGPDLRLEVVPHRVFDAMMAYRPFWLAAERDAWVPAGLRDTTGAAGSFVAHQLEARARVYILGKNLSLDVGGAQLVPGELMKSAPGARGRATTYGYVQVLATL